MMSDSLLIRVDTGKLYQPFVIALRLLLDEAFADLHTYFAISGYRSYLEQDNLYSQGRTTPGHLVTHARAGESSHNFGIAVDLCLDGSAEKGLQPDYRIDGYAPLGPLCVKHGLDWGGHWAIKDYGHISWPGYETSKQLEPLRHSYELSGLVSVFEYLSKGNSNGFVNS